MGAEICGPPTCSYCCRCRNRIRWVPSSCKLAARASASHSRRVQLFADGRYLCFGARDQSLAATFQFFDTFHELMHPVYVSKYFPAQGLFLAAGEKLLGNPAVGVWLSSALACAAVFWMLEAWVAGTWALLGALLMVVHIGVFSYWSQSYWGGMVAALGNTGKTERSPYS